MSSGINFAPPGRRAIFIVRQSLMRLLGLFLLATILLTLGVSFYLPGVASRHFIFLADSFVHGSFAVNNLPSDYADKVIVGGNVYLPLAPMPAILLMPFVGVGGTGFDEHWLAYFFTTANALLLWTLLKRLSVDERPRRWLIALFFFGTIYLSALVTARSWFLAHLVATTFLFLAIHESLGKQRAWLIGAWLGLAFLTRSTTILALPFFVWLLKPADATWRELRWLVRLGVQFAMGLALPVFFFLYYNDARFGSVFETGYARAVVGSPILVTAMQQGLFSPIHLAKNLYALLLAMPLPYPSFSAPTLEFPYLYPSPWGMGIFFTTPAFIYLFAANWRDHIVRAAGLAVACVALPLLLYYGVGWMQFGFRYALDFYPFLFLMTALGLARRFDRTARGFIVASIVINVWGAWWQMMGFLMLPVELQW